MNLPAVTVRPMARQDIIKLVPLHQAILDDEFIVQFGGKFLCRYYRAFIDSPYAVALVAFDNQSEQYIGALLGTIRPALHYRFLTKRYGIGFAMDLFLRCVARPKLGYSLVQTRLKRYIKGVIRSLIRTKAVPSAVQIPPEQVADITHLFVDTTTQGKGVGRRLVDKYEYYAVREGVTQIDLVTSSEEHGAGRFYEKLGWSLADKITSQSGETFLLYRKKTSNPNCLVDSSVVVTGN